MAIRTRIKPQVGTPELTLQGRNVRPREHNRGSLRPVAPKKWAPEGAHRCESEKKIRSEVVVESEQEVTAHRTILMHRRVVGQEYAAGAVALHVHGRLLVEEIGH